MVQAALARLLIFSALMALPGCIGAAVHGAKYGLDQSTIEKYQAAAEQGDAAAQYKVGEAYCCSTEALDGVFKDNQKATQWLCRAAHQNYQEAQYRLARIYSGRLISGLRLKERALDIASTYRDNKPLALMWARLAAVGSDGKVAKDVHALQTDLETAMTDQEKQQADAFGHDWQNAPCMWRQVYPES